MLVLVLLQRTSGQEQQCEWDWAADAARGLDPRSLDAGARRLAVLRDVRDMESCQAACCAEPTCQLAMIGTPADGAPECLLVGCTMRDGRDACVLQPSTQFTVYRKKATVVENSTDTPPSSPDAGALSEGRSVDAGKGSRRQAPGTRQYVDFVWRRAAPPLSV